MRHQAHLFAALLILSSAQGASAWQAALSIPAQVVAIQPPTDSCPVSFSARRQSSTEQIAIGTAASRHRNGQGVTLSLGRPDSPIRSAEVLVHASSNTPHALPLARRAPADLARTFHLAGPAARDFRSTSLWLDGAGSILSVDLLSITYTDGSVWTHDPTDPCSAVPSGYLLVSSR